MAPSKKVTEEERVERMQEQKGHHLESHGRLVSGHGVGCVTHELTA